MICTPCPLPASPVKVATRRTAKRVLLVDDHAIVRTGLASLINQAGVLTICGEADDLRSALEAVEQLRPDVAVVDWSLGNHDSAELIETLVNDYPEMPVLVLSMHDEVLYADRAFRAGARGYVMKQEATERIVEAILSVSSGKRYFSDRAAEAIRLCRNPSDPPTPASLQREAEAPSAMLSSAGPVGPPALELQTTPYVSIVIPVYNGEATIDRLVRVLIREFSAIYELQIVLVDDGSSDRSPEICRGLHEEYPGLIDFVLLARNFGEHNAVMAGLNCAEGEYCVIMDDDFQNPPSEVKTLIDEIRKGHDVVYVRYQTKHHSWRRNLGSRFHNWVATRALRKPKGLYLSSFKALSRFVVREVLHYTGPAPYLDAIILRTTRKIGVVPVRHEPAQREQSNYTMRKLVGLWANMIVGYSLLPARLLGFFGLVAAIFGLVYGAYTMLSYLKSPGGADPFERLSANLWFFRGGQLLFLALVAEYVARIYMHLNRDPQFIIRRVMRHRAAKEPL